jgi:hypothetical protein
MIAKHGVEEQVAEKDFAVFDADSHVVEPPALWEKYLDLEYRALGKHALWRQEGRTGARHSGEPRRRMAYWRQGPYRSGSTLCGSNSIMQLAACDPLTSWRSPI